MVSILFITMAILSHSKLFRTWQVLTITRSLSVSIIFCVRNSSFLLSFSSLRAIFKKSLAPFRVYLLRISRYTSTSSFWAFSLSYWIVWEFELLNKRWCCMQQNFEYDKKHKSSRSTWKKRKNNLLFQNFFQKEF